MTPIQVKLVLKHLSGNKAKPYGCQNWVTSLDKLFFQINLSDEVPFYHNSDLMLYDHGSGQSAPVPCLNDSFKYTAVIET